AARFEWARRGGFVNGVVGSGRHFRRADRQLGSFLMSSRLDGHLRVGGEVVGDERRRCFWCNRCAVDYRLVLVSRERFAGKDHGDVTFRSAGFGGRIVGRAMRSGFWEGPVVAPTT